MSLPRFVTDEAIVLKRTNYGEADRLVTILTKNHGRITVIAKGVRKLGSKKSAHLEPFTHIRVYLLGQYSLPIVTQAETIEGFASIRQDFESARQAFRALESVERLTVEGEVYLNVFALLIGCLEALDTGRLTSADSFLADFLTEMGYGGAEAGVGSNIESVLEKLIDRKLVSSSLT